MSSTYDAQARRKLKAAGSATKVYVTDADNREILEYDGAGGTRMTFIPDMQGSILATLDLSCSALTRLP